jgi:hypothetical protein
MEMAVVWYTTPYILPSFFWINVCLRLRELTRCKNVRSSVATLELVKLKWCSQWLLFTWGSHMIWWHVTVCNTEQCGEGPRTWHWSNCLSCSLEPIFGEHKPCRISLWFLEPGACKDMLFDSVTYSRHHLLGTWVCWSGGVVVQQHIVVTHCHLLPPTSVFCLTMLRQTQTVCE